MSNYKISIITVVKNGEGLLENTILSVLNQTYHPIEYIIIDGGSTDGTPDIIKSYAKDIESGSYPKFKNDAPNEIPNKSSPCQMSVYKWISEDDEGVYSAINKGIEMATGEYIGLVHASDWLEASACENIHSQIHSKKSASAVDMYYGMVRYFSMDGAHVKTCGTTMSFIGESMIAHPSCFIKKSFYESHFKYDLDYKSASDYDFMFKMHQLNTKTEFIEKVISNHRLGGLSSTKVAAMEKLYILKKHKYLSKYKFILKYLYLNISFLMKRINIL